MYVSQCPGGFSIPTIQGKQRVYGFSVPISNTAAASYFCILDGEGKVLGSLTDETAILGYRKGVADVDGNLEIMFPEPIKTRNGLDLYYSNIIAGSVCVYVG